MDIYIYVLFHTSHLRCFALGIQGASHFTQQKKNLGKIKKKNNILRLFGDTPSPENPKQEKPWTNRKNIKNQAKPIF